VTKTNNFKIAFSLLSRGRSLKMLALFKRAPKD